MSGVEARQAGFPMADRTAWRLGNQVGVMSVTVKTFRKRGKKPGHPVCDADARRKLTPTSPNLLWLRGITEHRTAKRT